MGGIGVGISVGGGRQAWTPKRLAGLLLWLSADSGVSDQRFAAEFNGTNQSLSVADNAALSAGDIAFWQAGWFEADTLTAGTFPTLWGKGNSGTSSHEYGANLNGTNGLASFSTGGAALRNVNTANASVAVGQRYFLMNYHDAAGDLIGISLNGGAFATTATAGTAPPDSTSAFRIGARNPTPDRFLDGASDRVCYGETPSSSMTAIRDLLYNGGAGLPYSSLTTQQKTDLGLVAYWMLDEASGQRNDSHGTNHLTDNNTVTRRARTLTLADGSPVYRVADRSVSANHATRVAVGNRPTYETAVFGAKPALRFDGADDSLTMTAIALTGDFTLSWSGTVTSTPGAYFGHASGTGKIVQTDADTLTVTNDAGTALALDHLTLDAALHEVVLVRASGVVTRYVDGLEDGSGALSGTITLDRIGIVGASTNPLSADLADIILYDRAYT